MNGNAEVASPTPSCRSFSKSGFQNSKIRKVPFSNVGGIIIVMMLSGQDVAQHASRESLWIIVENAAYDVTEYLDDHPGGATILLRYGGKVRMIIKMDRTCAETPTRMQQRSIAQYIHQALSNEHYLQVCNAANPTDRLGGNSCTEKHLGPVDPSTIAQDDNAIVTAHYDLPPDAMPLSVCQNLDDIELIARSKLTRKAWAYYNSAADSLFSQQTNRGDWSKVSFRPRVLQNVARVDMRRKVMGHTAELPFFIAPAAMAKLGHPDGEMCLSNGASARGIVYCPSTYSSVDHHDLTVPFKSKDNLGAMAFQLYVPRQLEGAEELIKKCRSLGCTALVVTVDTPVVGKREEDERYKAEVEHMEGEVVPRVAHTNPLPADERPILRGHHSSTLNWADLPYLRDIWGKDTGPFILKGIMTVEDAVRAAEAGVDGIYLSNHGGRQLDYAPSSIRTLLEIRKFRPDILKRMDVYLDGGVRRGTDILKAIALGATGVGLGRPFMYAVASGTDGVLRAIQLLSDEIETTMRLLGVNSLDELNPSYLNCSILERELPEHNFRSAVRRIFKL